MFVFQNIKEMLSNLKTWRIQIFLNLYLVQTYITIYNLSVLNLKMFPNDLEYWVKKVGEASICIILRYNI